MFFRYLTFRCLSVPRRGRGVVPCRSGIPSPRFMVRTHAMSRPVIPRDVAFVSFVKPAARVSSIIALNKRWRRSWTLCAAARAAVLRFYSDFALLLGFA